MKFSAGAFSAHWVLLIPCPLRVSLPLAFSFFVCVCVLIIQWLLACFPNPTWTFLSATEKLGFPSTGKQSERPGRIPALCTSPPGHGPCPVAEEEAVRTPRSMCEQKALRSHVVHSHLRPTLQTRVACPRGLQRLAQVTQVQSKAKRLRFSKRLPQSLFQSRNHSTQKAFPHTKALHWKGYLTN